MTSVATEINRLNEAVEALKANQGWGLGFLRNLERKSTHAEVKSLAAKALKEHGACI